MSAGDHRVMIMCVEEHFSTPRLRRQDCLRHSNIQKNSRLPAAFHSLDREIVKCHRFHVRALMMPFRIERFALGGCLHKVNFISLVDLHFSYAQQQTLGVFEKDQLLQEIEQQHVELVVREFDLACLRAAESPQCCRSSRSSSRPQRR